MNGRAEVSRLEQRLDATFNRISSLGPEPEVQSDFARYLCILVSGYLETAVSELLLEHARNNGRRTLQTFVAHNLKHFTNAKAQTLVSQLSKFDPQWGHAINSFLIEDKKDAVDSVVALRNQIAHGQSVSVTYIRICEYYKRIKTVVSRIADICVPA